MWFSAVFGVMPRTRAASFAVRPERSGAGPRSRAGSDRRCPERPRAGSPDRPPSGPHPFRPRRACRRAPCRAAWRRRRRSPPGDAAGPRSRCNRVRRRQGSAPTATGRVLGRSDASPSHPAVRGDAARGRPRCGLPSRAPPAPFPLDRGAAARCRFRAARTACLQPSLHRNLKNPPMSYT